MAGVNSSSPIPDHTTPANDGSSSAAHWVDLEPNLERCYKRQKRPETRQDDPAWNEELRYVISHEVRCTQDGIEHKDHPESACFSDEPRIFAGDNMARPLRGYHPIDVSFMRDPETVFIAQRSYSCTKYHQKVARSFCKVNINVDGTRFKLPVHSSLLPYCYVVVEDQPVADSVHEELILPSSGIKDILYKAGLVTRSDLSLLESGLFRWQMASLHLYHIRRRIRELLPTLHDKTDRRIVELLLEYVEANHGNEYAEADVLFARGFVSFEHFPKLFGLGDIIATPARDFPTAFKLEFYPSFSGSVIRLDGYLWEFDGSFRKEQERMTIEWPGDDAEVPITVLSSYPLKYDMTGLRDRLRQRGENFWKCRHRRFVDYKPTDTKENLDRETLISSSRYMIDIPTYKKLGHSSRDSVEDEDGRDELGPVLTANEDPPSEEFTLLLPSRIRGFHMEDKKWRLLNVENIQDVDWNKRAFQRLVLDSQKKEMIEALAKVHISTPTDSDIIEGKGNGLIILLHGPPGTGKTLTAESVAELAERPLYRVTCGDIGTEAETVENYLGSVFHLGGLWKAVVLLDESDIFLEERSQADLQRNALVSVFLRALEYYDGILILTSNRVGLFDEAFKSRVQLALHYPPLNRESRWEIWNDFLTELQEKGADMDWEEIRRKIDTLARCKLNGRQIRNSIRSARQLAQHRGQSLGYRHIEQTIRLLLEFEDYVEKTHGHTDKEWARSARTRNDRDSEDLD